MKKLLFFAALLAVSFTTFAESYNLISLSYENIMMSANDKLKLEGSYFLTDEAGKNQTGSFNGLGIEYNRGIGISSKHPMFVEVGGKVNFTFYNRSISDFYDGVQYNQKFSLIRLAVPVSYAYRFNLNKKMTLTPFVGLDLRFNLSGSEKETIIEGSSSEEDVYNPFDDDDFDDYTWKRFQLGWHIGARLTYARYFAGLNFGTDFNPIVNYKGMKLNTFDLSLNVGFKF